MTLIITMLMFLYTTTVERNIPKMITFWNVISFILCVYLFFCSCLTFIEWLIGHERTERWKTDVWTNNFVWNERKGTWQADRRVYDFTSNEENEPSQHKQDLSIWQVKRGHHHVHSFQSLKIFQDLKKKDILKKRHCVLLYRSWNHIFICLLVCYSV